MAKFFHILVEEDLSIDLLCIHENWTSIKFRNEENVIEPHKHVKHDNFENFTKSLKIT